MQAVTVFLSLTMQNRITRSFSILFFIFCLAGLALVRAQAPTQQRFQRARRPAWDSRTEPSAFFLDAFADALVGERPADFGGGARSVPPDGGNPTRDPGGNGATYGWQKIVSATTIEDEVKRIKLEVDKTVTTLTKYKGGGYKRGRRHFSVLAMLLAIITEYDGDVRWKEQSALGRDLFARAGFNAKVGTDQSYNEAKARKQDLQTLVSGGNLDGKPGAEPNRWDKICDRPPLMQTLEEAHQNRIVLWTASRAEFTNHSEDIVHEAEMIAAICEVLKQEGFEFADDDDYVGYCEKMQGQALEIVDAVKLNSHEAARAAAGQISKTCSECHENYRA